MEECSAIWKTLYADDTASSVWSGIWFEEESGLLISELEKLSWFHLTGLITLVLLMQKWIGVFVRKNYLLQCCGWISLLSLDWGSYIISIAKNASRGNWSLNSFYEGGLNLKICQNFVGQKFFLHLWGINLYGGS